MEHTPQARTGACVSAVLSDLLGDLYAKETGIPVVLARNVPTGA